MLVFFGGLIKTIGPDGDPGPVAVRSSTSYRWRGVWSCASSPSGQLRAGVRAPGLEVVVPAFQHLPLGVGVELVAVIVVMAGPSKRGVLVAAVRDAVEPLDVIPDTLYFL